MNLSPFLDFRFFQKLDPDLWRKYTLFQAGEKVRHNVHVFLLWFKRFKAVICQGCPCPDIGYNLFRGSQHRFLFRKWCNPSRNSQVTSLSRNRHTLYYLPVQEWITGQSSPGNGCKLRTYNKRPIPTLVAIYPNTDCKLFRDRHVSRCEAIVVIYPRTENLPHVAGTRHNLFKDR